jgi:hypothetical protein
MVDSSMVKFKVTFAKQQKVRAGWILDNFDILLERLLDDSAVTQSFLVKCCHCNCFPELLLL